MADGCFYTEDADSIQKIFTQNFLEHYTKSKAPFPLFFHAAWFFNRAHRKEGFLKFIDSILALPDLYFVTSQELIAWTRYPEPLPAVISSLFFLQHELLSSSGLIITAIEVCLYHGLLP